MRTQRGILRPAIVASLVATLSLGLAAAPAEADSRLHVRPHSGPPGTLVHVRGEGFPPPPIVVGCTREYILEFVDASLAGERIGGVVPDHDGNFRLRFTIPQWAAAGIGFFEIYYLRYSNGRCHRGGPITIRAFTVTHPLATVTVAGLGSGQAEAASPAVANVRVNPIQGPGGTSVHVKGCCWRAGESVTVTFRDAGGTRYGWGSAKVGTGCHLSCRYLDIGIPAHAAVGAGFVKMYSFTKAGKTTFTVTAA